MLFLLRGASMACGRRCLRVRGWPCASSVGAMENGFVQQVMSPGIVTSGDTLAFAVLRGRCCCSQQAEFGSAFQKQEFRIMQFSIETIFPSGRRNPLAFLGPARE